MNISNNIKFLATGGSEGEVRIWELVKNIIFFIIYYNINIKKINFLLEIQRNDISFKRTHK